MRTSRKLSHALLALVALVMMSAAALAADPGLVYPPTSEISDQKAGSLLVYNYHTSSLANATTNDTRFSITNTSSTSSVAVHMFFVGSSVGCTTADVFICLTPNQTASFRASEQDPDTTGYLIAYAVDGLGCPRLFNHLIGDEFIKAGPNGTRVANLGAEAIAAIPGPNGDLALPLACSGASSDTVLTFTGAPGSYNRLPRVLAVSSMGSITDSEIFLIVNRIGGNLQGTTATLGTLFGFVFDEGEAAYSFSFTGGCQFQAALTTNLPRTSPRLNQIIRSGSTGWMKFWSPTQNSAGGTDFGILGAVITTSSSSTSQANAFNGGHNLHKLTLTTGPTITVPIFPPSCL